MLTTKRCLAGLFLLALSFRLLAAGSGPGDEVSNFDQLLRFVRSESEPTVVLERCGHTVFTLNPAQRAQLTRLGANKVLIDALEKPRMALDDVQNFALIVDCSGSMQEMLPDGRSKMEAATTVLTELVRRIPDGMSVSLTVYGHDTALGCRAVAVKRPLGPIDSTAKEELTRIIDGLQPRGSTPIAAALQAAGGTLAGAQGLSQIVLVTDGMETCHGDPGGVAEALTLKQGLRRVEVVGLGMKPEEKEAVKRIARRGRGKFYEARTAQDLAPALKKVVRTAPTGEVRREETTPADAPQEPAKLSPPRLIKGHTNNVVAVAFSPDGRLLATGGDDKTIRIWEVSTGLRKDRLSHHSEVFCLTFSADGKALASGDKEGTVTLWDVDTGEKRKTISKIWTAPVVRIRCAPDGETIGIFGRGAREAGLYSLTRDKWAATLKGHSDCVKALEFSPDGQTVATASNDSSIRLWNVGDGTEKDSLKAHDGPVNCLAFTPDGTRLASGGRDGTVIVWDLKTGNVIKPVCEGHRRAVVFLAHLPDGRIFTRTFGGGERIWDPSRNHDVTVTKDYEGQIYSFGDFYWSGLALSPDGRTFAVAGSDRGPGGGMDRSDAQLHDLSRFLESSE